MNDRDLRQRDIVPPERLAASRATVIGVVAIGRQVALQLAAMGVRHLQLVDPDIVETVNLACQGYLESDLGKPKVEATAEQCKKLNSDVELLLQSQRFRRSMALGNVLFCCVDSIQIRRLIWEAVQHKVDFFADGRMSAEVIRVLAVADFQSRTHYPLTLFFQEDAYVVASCTAKSTIFTANIAAGLMLSQFSKWLRRMPVEPDMCLNLLSSELTLLVGES